MNTRSRKPKPVVEFRNAGQVAKELGINRSTLTRLHGRGAVAECKHWGTKPQPHRLYSEEEFEAVKKAVETSRRGKAPESVTFIIDKVVKEDNEHA